MPKTPEQKKKKQVEKLTPIISPSKRIGSLMKKEHLKNVVSVEDFSEPHISNSLLMSGEFSEEEKKLISSGKLLEPVTSHGVYLPLEMFDDEEYELHTPQEWVEFSKKANAPIAKSKYYTGASYVFTPCFVLEHDPADNSYLIRWEQTKNTKKVKRLNLLFNQDDESKWVERVNKAVVRRQQAEKQMRYWLEVEKIEDNEVKKMSEEEIKNIIKKVKIDVPKPFFHIVRDSVAEFTNFHSKTMKQAIFNYLLRDPEEFERMKELDLPPFKESAAAPELGVVELPEHVFQKDFGKVILASDPGLFGTVTKLNYEWESYGKEIVFDSTLRSTAGHQPFELTDFVKKENESVQNFIQKLKEEWIIDSMSIIRNNLDENVSCLEDKVNFYLDSMEVFNSGLLKKFIGLVNMLMSSQLKQKIIEEVNKFERFFEEYEVTQTEFDPHGISGKIPLFQIQIIENNGRLMFNTNLEDFLSGIHDIFLNLVEKPLSLPMIDWLLFTMLDLPKNNLNSLKLHEPVPASAWAHVEKILRDNFRKPFLLLETYKKYEKFLIMKPEEYAAHAVEATDGNSDKIREKLLELYSAATSVLNESSHDVTFDMIRVKCSPIKLAIKQHVLAISFNILKSLSKGATQASEDITKNFEKIHQKIQQTPQTPEELDELRKYIMEVSKEIRNLQQSFEKVKGRIDMLNDFSYVMPDKDFSTFVSTFALPKKVFHTLNESQSKLEDAQKKFVQELTEDVESLKREITDYTSEIESFIDFSEMEKIPEYYARVVDMKNKISAAKEKAKLYNAREKMFAFPSTDFAELKNLEKDFKYADDLWTTAYLQSEFYPKWMSGKFKELSYNEVNNYVQAWLKTLSKLSRTIKHQGPQTIAKELLEKVQDFKKHLPLIQALRNEGLRERHWKKISTVLGYEGDDIRSTLPDNYSLKDVISSKYDFESRIEDIARISRVASAEYKIEIDLEQMENQWKDIEFVTAPYADTYKLVELDEIAQNLDEHIVKTQSIRASPFARDLEDDVKRWESKLLNRQETLDEWVKCQVSYVYLEPIFSSEDIKRELPHESNQFQIVDKMWHTTMETTNKTKNFVQIISIENLKENFQNCNNTLENVHKKLKEHLEKKRQEFPRFYFLSDDSLLEVISETKDPQKVQPHLKQCFEGINILHFTPDQEITAMESKEKEIITLIKRVIPKNYPGKVEAWLKEVEDSMRMSIRDVIMKSIKSYATSKRSKWIKEWPGQVVLCVSQLFWTKETEDAIKSHQIKKYVTKLKDQLKDLINLVRSNLTTLERITLGALVVMDVHQQDVVTQLAKIDISDINDFDWKNQLRYYWEGSPTEGDMFVKQVTASISYGYEYLGNTTRLVITPLTDRCYRTLMGALQLNFGGAPEGPAGTGKTETTKDLARAMAKQCIVFNWFAISFFFPENFLLFTNIFFLSARSQHIFLFNFQFFV